MAGRPRVLPHSHDGDGQRPDVRHHEAWLAVPVPVEVCMTGQLNLGSAQFDTAIVAEIYCQKSVVK